MGLILLAGYRRSGKSTVANELLRVGMASDKLSLADPLRWGAQELLRPFITNPQDRHKAVYGDKDKFVAETPCTGRDLLIALGDACRGLCPDWFVRSACLRLSTVLPGTVVIDDARVEVEMELLKFEPGHLFWLERDGTQGGGHNTEAGVLRQHATIIDNNGTLQETVRQIAAVMEKK